MQIILKGDVFIQCILKLNFVYKWYLLFYNNKYDKASLATTTF